MIKNGFWVFGYGSLIWQPDIPFSKKHIAKLKGYARSFCMWSIHHRGTQENPGLVLALDKQANAECSGVAFFVEPDHAEEAITNLRARELISSAYYEVLEPVLLDTGQHVDALCYVINPDHAQYCGGLSLEEQALTIARATGGRGPNTEYLYKTCEGITALGLKDDSLHALQKRVVQLCEKE